MEFLKNKPKKIMFQVLSRSVYIMTLFIWKSALELTLKLRIHFKDISLS